MKRLKYLLLLPALLPLQLYAIDKEDAEAKDYFYTAKQHIEAMLNGDAPLSYERAIYEIENAWWEGGITYEEYTTALDYHTRNIRLLMSSNADSRYLSPKGDLQHTAGEKLQLYQHALANYAIYQYMTADTFEVMQEGNTLKIPRTPLQYATLDPLGTTDWTNTHITHLINTGKGNCFALSSLYKIFSERLHSDALLCTAPGHIYIRHADEKGVYYNVELGSRSFPGTGMIEAITHSPATATKNGIALRELTTEQTVALCLVYLAKGYEYKLGADDQDFMLACAEKALEYDEQNLNAMLLKAEVLEATVIAKNKTIAELQGSEELKAYEQWLTHIYKLGYREAPYAMKNLLLQGWARDTLLPANVEDHTPDRAKDVRYAGLTYGLFDEEIQAEQLERYGNTIYNTRTHTIVGFTTDDILYNHYTFDPVVFAWNMDPEVRYGINPYIVFSNNPINRIDILGNVDEWVQTGDGQIKYDSRVKNQEDAVALYGEGSSYRPNGHQYMATNDSRIELGDYGFFKQDGQIHASIDFAERSIAYTNPVKAMADVQPQISRIRAQMTIPYAITTGISTDISTPEPTDAVWPKWLVYGISASVSAHFTVKMEKEIEGIMRRAGGKQGFQYALIAENTGTYICYNCLSGKMDLSVGNVWKYGETTNKNRYTQGQLKIWGVKMYPEFFGNQVQIKVMEKRKIYGYFIENGHLPPGNKIFR